MEKESEINDLILLKDGEIYLNSNRDFDGVFIPKELYLFPGLSPKEKFILLEIKSLCREKGCFASNEYLGRYLMIGKQQVSNIVAKLLDMGLITREFLKEKGRNKKKRILKTSESAIKEKLYTLYKKNYIPHIRKVIVYNELDIMNKKNNNSKELYSEPDGSHKNSLKKQMGLEDNSKEQKSPNKKKRRELSQEDENKIRNCPFTMRVINLWNSFSPVTPQHKFPSFIWKSIHLSLNQLRKGTFYQRHNWSGSEFDLFCQMNKITSQQIKHVLDRPFKKKEIIEGIKLLVSYCKQGNFIKRQGYSKTLSLMLYNEESPFVSMFALGLIKGEAKPVSELMEIKCKYPKIAERLRKIEDLNLGIKVETDYNKMSVVDKKQFNRIFSEIEERLKSIPKNNCERPGLWDFIGAYFDKLQYLGLDKYELRTFSPWSWQWKKICSSDVRPFNQITQWTLEKKEIDKIERQQEYRRNNPIADDEYYGD